MSYIITVLIRNSLTRFNVYSLSDNVKALFRRGKANISVWKMNEAREDLKHLSTLDPSMQVSVNRLLCQINEALKIKDDEDRQKLRGKLF